MRRPFKRPAAPHRKQPTPQELLDTLLGFIQTHFYPSDPIEFVKDRPRLLKWVVLRLAAWLNERGVTISCDQYREIMIAKILMVAVQHGNTGCIAYRPAWLGKVVESHLGIHGEEYYDAAKAIRALVDQTLLMAGRQTRVQPDPVREFAAASRLLQTGKKVKKLPPQAPVNPQLSLL